MSDQLEVNKTLLVVLALHALGGEADVEHIAVKAHELFPQQFSWRSFPQFPDKDAVRVHLSEAKKQTAGKLVTDKDLRFERRGDQGYTKRFALTQRGFAKAVELQHALKDALSSGRSVGAAPTSLEYKRIIAPILDSEAFEQFANGRDIKQIGPDSFLQAFKLFPDASAFVITSRIGRAAALAAQLNEPERNTLERFILGGRNAFGF